MHEQLMRVPFPFVPSREQFDIARYIFSNPESSVAVSAVAGAGKTTLLSFIDKARRLYFPQRQLVCLTYSKRLAADMREIIGSGDNVRTTHSYMFQILIKYARNNNIPRVLVNDDVAFFLTKAQVDKYYGVAKRQRPPDAIAGEYWASIRAVEKLVTDIRKNLLPTSNPDELVQWCRDNKRLVDSNDVNDAIAVVNALTRLYIKKGQVDFIGQLYLPHVIDMTKYFHAPDMLAIDESNDSYRLLREAYKLIAGPQTQVISTGDPSQTIHMWNGAEPDCFHIMAAMFKSHIMSYNTSFRLSKSVCEYMQSSGLDERMNVPQNAVKGVLDDVNYHRFLMSVSEGDPDTKRKPDMVLCRYNKGSRVEFTLEKVSLALLSLGKAVMLLGSSYVADIKFVARVIGSHVLTMKVNEVIPFAEKYIQQMVDAENGEENPRQHVIAEWKKQLEIFRMYYQYYERKVPSNGRSIEHFIKFCERLYSEDDATAIVLSSIYKAKGRQTRTVYVMHGEVLEDAMYFAETLEERLEARNLLYVALTRATHETYVVGWSLPKSYPTVEEIKEEYRRMLEKHGE
jgi:superfamily I DNA/RNA helicase